MLEIGGRLNKLQTPKQLEKLKAKIASKPAEKTMTYLAPAGSGKPVPLKTRIKKIPKPEIEKIIPNPKVTTKALLVSFLPLKRHQMFLLYLMQVSLSSVI